MPRTEIARETTAERFSSTGDYPNRAGTRLPGAGQHPVGAGTRLPCAGMTWQAPVLAGMTIGTHRFVLCQCYWFFCLTRIYTVVH